MSSTQHKLIEQCATRLRGIVEALDNIHDTSPQRWSTDLDDVHSSAESLLALINDQAPTQDIQGLAGNGSLRHPCPAHERAAFELFVRKHCGMPEHIAVNWDAKFTNDAWEGWQARAALAQPSPVRSNLLINGYQLRDALEFIAPDGTAEQLESEARIEWRQQDADFLEAGLYAWCAEYPEEGCVLLDEEPATAQPSPAQAEQAEAEQHERLLSEACASALNQRDAALANVDALAVQVLKLGGTISFAHHRTDQAGQVPQAWLDVQAERRRQVEAEGWTPEHDDEHDTGALASAAGCYAMFSLAYPAGDPSRFWPWDKSWWKPSPDGRRNMVKAGALILAEIERLDRVAASQGGPSDA